MDILTMVILVKVAQEAVAEVVHMVVMTKELLVVQVQEHLIKDMMVVTEHHMVTKVEAAVVAQVLLVVQM